MRSIEKNGNGLYVIGMHSTLLGLVLFLLASLISCRAERFIL